MAEEIIVRQNRALETEIVPVEPRQPASGRLNLKGFENPLTPTQLLLASLGSCTTTVLHSYAQYHNLNLQAVEIHLTYRHFIPKEDEKATDDQRHDQIEQQITLIGELDPEIHRRIFLICRRCQIFSMIERGVSIKSQLMN